MKAMLLILISLFSAQSFAAAPESIDTYQDGELDPGAKVIPDSLQLNEVFVRRIVKSVPNSHRYQSFLNKGISEKALEAAFLYFESHPDQIINAKYVSVVDFSLPATEKRFFVLNLKTESVESFFVAHGYQSGFDQVEQVSNQVGSGQSSQGAFITGEVILGKYGRALRLDGMEKSNSNARMRNLVVLGSDFVSEEYIRRSGHLGFSNHCFALDRALSNSVIAKIRGGSLLFAYWNLKETL